MKDDHKRLFSGVATDKKCWIAVREPNPLGDQWHGMAGFVPKPKECHAKTANAPSCPYQGLVVDPGKRPEAFINVKQARGAWDNWMTEHDGHLPSGFACITSGPAAGVVTYMGAAMFSDYDLLSILPADSEGKRIGFAGNADQMESASLALENEVLSELRRRFGGEFGLNMVMVQHGQDLNFPHPPTWGENEAILWFGPNNQFEMGRTSPPKTVN